ncbi:MAG: hypothetical protein SF187_23700 [Deltaproteobacteria bacterium]|nr:hypothetical protein [Deltaproteobacteria bacterium]
MNRGWPYDVDDGAPLTVAPGPDDGAIDAGYAIRDGCTVRIDVDRNGDERVDVLATFVARIEEEITIDDGVDTSRIFRISCRLKDGTRVKDALVPALEFEGLSWVLRNWGLRALVFSGGGRRDHLRTAIQLMSCTAGRRTVYTHTGWRQEGDEWIYLYQGGAVGIEGVEVRLDGAFERFALPAQTLEVERAIAASLSLLDCGPSEVTVPLLAATYAAPLSFILNPDFAVWVVGLTGSLKSELASLAQRHFGPFTRKTLPGSWSSTSNSLESLLSVTKDMLAVIDDFAPQADGQTQREQTKRAEVILRNVGNHAGRGRLKPDLTQRPVRPPRALVLCTGEDHPPTPSIVARLVLVQVDRTKLDFAAVSRTQAEGERLPHAMRAYVEWLRPRIVALKESLPRELAELMTTTFSSATLGGHMRAPSGLATLYLGLRTFAEFAVDNGVLEGMQALKLLEEAKVALIAIGKRQAALGDPEGTSNARTDAHTESPSQRFITALRELLAAGRVWLGSSEGLHACGPSTAFVGWCKGEVVHFLPEPAHRAVTSYLRECRRPLVLSCSKLVELLVAEGLVLDSDTAHGFLQQVNAERRVLVLPAKLILPEKGGAKPRLSIVASPQRLPR